jgi:hypothetical protein
MGAVYRLTRRGGLDRTRTIIYHRGRSKAIIALEGYDMAVRHWTREELVMALSLYCRIPFGQFRHGNSDVQMLANIIGRTPSAVALKLSNFASFDPELQERGIKGMQNASVADREIWDEFYGHWDVLAEHVELEKIDEDILAANEPSAPAKETESVAQVKQRRGQAFFREAILAAYFDRCCITGIAHRSLLRASHIIPWAVDAKLRLNPHNGLCLNSLHDAAFDRGLITFGPKLELVLSQQLEPHIPQEVFHNMFKAWEGKSIEAPERFAPSSTAMEYHRSHVFQA